MTHRCTSPPPSTNDVKYYNYAAINQQSRLCLETSAMLLVPPSAPETFSTEPTPPPRRNVIESNRSNNCSLIRPTDLQEVSLRENIYDEPVVTRKCTSPPPSTNDVKYYNYSAINQQSRLGLQTSAVLLAPPSAAKRKPTPPPKP